MRYFEECGTGAGKDRGWVQGSEKKRQRAADVSVAGDVSDCICDSVHALSVLVRNFDGEFLFDGENNLRSVSKGWAAARTVHCIECELKQTHNSWEEAAQKKRAGQCRGGSGRYFNNVEGIEAEVIGEVGSGGHLHLA
jgi:hypothetical protein